MSHMQSINIHSTSCKVGRIVNGIRTSHRGEFLLNKGKYFSNNVDPKLYDGYKNRLKDKVPEMNFKEEEHKYYHYKV